MVGQPRRNFTKMASWSRASEHLVNPIGMSDQLKWNNQYHQEKIKKYSVNPNFNNLSIPLIEDHSLR
jgi:hypothetical protein